MNVVKRALSWALGCGFALAAGFAMADPVAATLDLTETSALATANIGVAGDAALVIGSAVFSAVVGVFALKLLKKAL